MTITNDKLSSEKQKILLIQNNLLINKDELKKPTLSFNDSQFLSDFIFSYQDINKINFVTEIEKKYHLSFYKDFPFNENNLIDIEHSLKLMNAAFEYLYLDKNLIAAEIFCAALILYENYFYNFHFALCLYKLNEHKIALDKAILTIKEIKDQPQLDLEIMTIIENSDFNQKLHFLIINLFLFNNKVSQAATLMQNDLQNGIIQDINYLNSLKTLFNVYNQDEIVIKIDDRIKKSEQIIQQAPNI